MEPRFGLGWGQGFSKAGREKQWVQNFHLMCSKDNEYLPKYRREFFDYPLVYDVNGTRTYYYYYSAFVVRSQFTKPPTDLQQNHDLC